MPFFIAKNTYTTPKRSDLFANLQVTDQFGSTYFFREDLIRGKAVIINTMFTVCRGSCPGTSETLQRLRQPLSKLFGKRVTLLSLSIDPAVDDTRALLDYADNYGAGKKADGKTCDWYFLNASINDTEELRRSLGFYDLDSKVDQDITRHASFLLFGNDQHDRWSTSPTQIRDGLIFEPLRRVLGTTNEERFGIPTQANRARNRS
ncbi:MAG: SCO family protein [Planctomycetota bacterium]|jgi:protein SCO1/2|nr:SCO family protein [Planctomycetaceae bacterium]